MPTMHMAISQAKWGKVTKNGTDREGGRSLRNQFLSKKEYEQNQINQKTRESGQTRQTKGSGKEDWGDEKCREKVNVYLTSLE